MLNCKTSWSTEKIKWLAVTTVNVQPKRLFIGREESNSIKKDSWRLKKSKTEVNSRKLWYHKRAIGVKNNNAWRHKRAVGVKNNNAWTHMLAGKGTSPGRQSHTCSGWACTASSGITFWDTPCDWSNQPGICVDFKWCQLKEAFSQAHPLSAVWSEGDASWHAGHVSRFLIYFHALARQMEHTSTYHQLLGQRHTP